MQQFGEIPSYRTVYRDPPRLLGLRNKRPNHYHQHHEGNHPANIKKNKTTSQNSNPGKNLRKKTDQGWIATIPNFCANTPAMPGNAAAPITPTPAIHPMQTVTSPRGRICDECDMRMGSIGPRNMPMKAVWRGQGVMSLWFDL